MEELLVNYKDPETIIAVTVFILLIITIVGVVYIFTSMLEKKKLSLGLLIKRVIAGVISFCAMTLCIKIVKSVSETGKIIG